MDFSSAIEVSISYSKLLLENNENSTEFSEFATNCVEDLEFDKTQITDDLLQIIYKGAESDYNDYFINATVLMNLSGTSATAAAIKNKLNANLFLEDIHYTINNGQYMLNYNTFKICVNKLKQFIQLCDMMCLVDALYKNYLVLYKFKRNQVNENNSPSLEEKKPVVKKRTAASEFTHYGIGLINTHGGGEYEYYIVRGTSIEDTKKRFDKKKGIEFIIDPRLPTYKDDDNNVSVAVEISKIKKCLTTFRKSEVIDIIRSENKIAKVDTQTTKDQVKVSNLPLQISQTGISLVKNNYISIEKFTEFMDKMINDIDDGEDIAPAKEKKEVKQKKEAKPQEIEEVEEEIINNQADEDELITNM